MFTLYVLFVAYRFDSTSKIVQCLEIECVLFAKKKIKDKGFSTPKPFVPAKEWIIRNPLNCFQGLVFLVVIVIHWNYINFEKREVTFMLQY